MKKVVVILGSPRKNGNTIGIVRKIEKNVKEIDPNVEFNYIYLIDKNLKYCQGCCFCLRAGGEACLIKDDAKDILKEMRSADGLIFASPGYAHQVSGLYKNFMDRFMFLDHLPEFIGVPAIIVSTSGGDGVGAVPKYMYNWGIRWWGCDVIDKLGIAYAFYFLSKRYRNKVDKRLQKTARKFHEAMVNKKLKRPTLSQYFVFMWNRTETKMGPKTMPARYKHWESRGWLNADYYYKTRINLFAKIIFSSMFKLMEVLPRMIFGPDLEEKMNHFTLPNNAQKNTMEN
jgi:multimeric flavodoxin WrbA